MNIARYPLSPESSPDRTHSYSVKQPLSPSSSTKSQAYTQRPPPLLASTVPPPSSPSSSSWGQGNLPTPPESAGANGMNGYMRGSAGPANGMNGYRNGGGMGGRPGGGGPGGPGGPGGGPGGPYGGSAGTSSPPSSISGGAGRMSTGTQMSSAESQQRKQGMLEDSLAQHYVVLRRYLGPLNQDDGSKPNRARDKLVRLSPVQFQELSTDVYDELRRRQASERPGGGNAPNSLPPRDNFHPKRNQARQKLSTLPVERFGALATDVFFELERRFPRFAGNAVERNGSPGFVPPQRIGSPGSMRPDSRGGPMGRRQGPRDGSFGANDRAIPTGIQPKSSQNNTAVPNKSYLVEEDDGDIDSVYNKRDTTATTKSNAVSDKIITEYQTQIDELNRKLSKLEGQLEDNDRFTQDKVEELKTKERQLQDKESEIDRLEERNRSSARNNDEAEQEFERLRRDLENRVADARALNENLEKEIDRIKTQNKDQEDDLRSQIDMAARKNNDGGEWRMRFNEMQQEQTGLKRENQDLQEQLRKQQTSTQSTKRELEGFLEEMKSIADQTEVGVQRETRLQEQVKSLEADLSMWKKRCAKMKTQIGQADSIPLVQPDVLKEAFVRPDGLVQYVHVTSFQLAVDEVLRIARARDPAALLDTLRTVVVAVKDICDDVPANAAGSTGQQRTKVSAMANNLITATKNYAAAKGLSPVSLVDAAAANLATAVVDLVHLVKMQPSPDRADLDLDGVAEEVIDDGEPELQLPEPEKRRPYLSATSMTESVYSTTTAPRASARLQTLPNSTYSAPQPPAPPGQRRASPSVGSSPARDTGSLVNGGTSQHRQQPSYASQSNGLASHRKQLSYASQASSQGGARRLSISRDAAYGSASTAQHRAQASYASQSSYNSQPPAPSAGAVPAPLGRSNDVSATGSTTTYSGSSSSSFADRYNAISTQQAVTAVSMTGPGAGPGPLSPFPNANLRLAAIPSPGIMNGAASLRVPSPAAPSAAAGPDPAAAELAIALDEESAPLIDSIQSLVTAIRTSQPPDLVRARAATVSNILSRILDAAQTAVQKSSPLANSAVARIVENLKMAQRRLGVADENAGSVIERGEEKGDAWREVVRVFPPVAFEVAREVRELGAKVKELSRGGAGDESEDDFR